MLAGFGGGNARVGGKAVEMLEAVSVRPGRKMGAALVSKTLLKTGGIGAGLRIAGGDGAAYAWIAAFKSDFADMETNYATKFCSEEMVFPEWRHAVELQSCAETQTGFRDRHPGKPFADGLERGRGDDGWAVGDEVVGDPGWIMANHDGVSEELAEPSGCGGGVSWKRECCDRDAAAVIWSGERNAGEVGRVGGAD